MSPGYVSCAHKARRVVGRMEGCMESGHKGRMISPFPARSVSISLGLRGPAPFLIRPGFTRVLLDRMRRVTRCVWCGNSPFPLVSSFKAKFPCCRRSACFIVLLRFQLSIAVWPAKQIVCFITLSPGLSVGYRLMRCDACEKTRYRDSPVIIPH